MRPADLQVPFEWDNRKIMIHDRVWYIPGVVKTPQTFDFPGWESPELFNNNNPIAVEYCSGNGLWIAEKAMQYPEINWVAVEMKYQRVRKIWSKIQNLKIPNLIVVCSEAMRVTERYFPSESIDQIYINFPDPWPKNRHAKNRLIQPTFLMQLERILRKQGSVTFVTDDFGYSDWTIRIFNENPRFVPAYPAPFYQTELLGYGSSYFEELWREKGKAIRYHQFIKERK